jgi:hypothetical protein
MSDDYIYPDEVEEPHNVEPGDEFDDEDTSWRYPRTLDPDIQMLVSRAMSVCSYRGSPRKYFSNKKERRQWERIQRGYMKTIPELWIEHCIEWAKKKNKRQIAITFDRLTNYMVNKQKMADWIAQTTEEERTTDLLVIDTDDGY